MKKQQRTVFILGLTMSFLINAGDYASKEIAEEQSRLQKAQRYTSISKKEATLSNLLVSLETAKNLFEVARALEVITSDVTLLEKTPAETLLKTSMLSNDFVVMKSGEALLLKKHKEGSVILKQFVTSEKRSMTYRILAAGVLADNSNLSGYPLVSEVVLTGSVPDSKLAVNVLAKYANHNGTIITKVGAGNTIIIDTNKVISEARPELQKLYNLYVQ